MKEEYTRWIEVYFQKCKGFVRGKCGEATTLMVEAFPELRRAAGFVHCGWGRDQHFWCVDPDGEVIDPTAAQFGGVIFQYEELDLNDPKTRAKVPTGRCPNCGEDTYSGRYLCDENCEREYAAYVDRESRQ